MKPAFWAAVLALSCSLLSCGGGGGNNNPPPPPITVQVTATVSGAGSVTSSPAGLSCSGGTCNGSFSQGAVVTFTAKPQPSNTLQGWSGACQNSQTTCNLTLNSNVNFGVTFVPAPTIQSVTPTTGATGTPVTITGMNFGATQGSSTVNFDGSLAVPVLWNATTITTTVPS